MFHIRLYGKSVFKVSSIGFIAGDNGLIIGEELHVLDVDSMSAAFIMKQDWKFSLAFVKEHNANCQTP